MHRSKRKLDSRSNKYRRRVGTPWSIPRIPVVARSVGIRLWLSARFAGTLSAPDWLLLSAPFGISSTPKRVLELNQWYLFNRRFIREYSESSRRGIIARTLVDCQPEQHHLISRITILIDQLHLFDYRTLSRFARSCSLNSQYIMIQYKRVAGGEHTE